MVPCAWCLAAAVSAAPASALAAERDPSFAIDIPAGPLPRSLAALSAQTGISIGTAGAIPGKQVAAVRGVMTAEEALRRLLAPAGLAAQRIGPTTWRLVRAPTPPRPPRRPARRPAQPLPLPPELAQGDIVVTGLRRPEPLFTTAASVSVVSGEAAVGNEPRFGSREIAARVEGLTLTNLGEGRNRQFIRGVADSPFNGYSQSTVSIALDDARITYDAPDPDLRLVDVARVEVLKGPQGPLYGTGALGGVYRIVTNRPDLTQASGWAELDGSALADGRTGGGASLMLNLPLVRDTLGFRASLYAAREPGWIDNIGGREDANRSFVRGGRAALRAAPAPGWTVDLAATAQYLTVDDTQYVPLRAESYRRPAGFPEPHDNDILIASAAVNGPVGRLRFSSTTSYVSQEFSTILDASAVAPSFGQAAPLRFSDSRHYRVLDQEARLSGGEAPGFFWIIGLSGLSAQSRVSGDMGPVRVVALSRSVAELAAYAQADVRLVGNLRAQPGLRLFTTRAESELTEGVPQSAHIVETRLGLSPSLSLSWQAGPDRELFLRYAGASRPAGLGASISGMPTQFRSDRLQTVELGGRLRNRDRTFSAEGAIYDALWHDLQSDYLLPDGLISTHNAGNAGILGVEGTLGWQVAPDWGIEIGGNVQHAQLESGIAVGGDRWLPVVADISGRAVLVHRFTFGGWSGRAEAAVNAVSASRLSFDPALDRRVPPYAVARAALSVARNGWTVSLDASNILGSRADTFAFGNPFTILEGRQFTPLEPLRLTLSLRRAFGR